MIWDIALRQISERRLLLWRAALALVGAIASFGLLWYAMPLGVDWVFTFSQWPAHWQDPYVIPAFTSPPWLLLLLPHALLPMPAGNAVNMMLNILVIAVATRSFGGGWVATVLALTSPIFVDLARTNNVDWVPLLGLLIGPGWGLPLIAAKPQGLGGAAIVWGIDAIRERNWRVFAPLLVVVILSVAWGFWPLRMHLPADVAWNFAPFPFGLPLGVWLLWQGIKRNDVALGAMATPFLTPYIAPYSVAGLLGIVAARYPTIGKTIWAGWWLFFIVESRRLALLLQR